MPKSGNSLKSMSQPHVPVVSKDHGRTLFNFKPFAIWMWIHFPGIKIELCSFTLIQYFVIILRFSKKTIAYSCISLLWCLPIHPSFYFTSRVNVIWHDSKVLKHFVHMKHKSHTKCYSVLWQEKCPKHHKITNSNVAVKCNEAS